jgi:ADP-heptose:LPS heptosyltransferase
MNIDLERKLDFWLGIPLCALLSFFVRCRAFVNREKKVGRSVQKIVFIKLSELGALVLSYPLISAVKADYPSAEVFCITFRKNEGIFKLLGNIIPESNVFYIRDDSLVVFVRDTVKILYALRRARMDAVIDLEFFSRFSAIVSFFSGAWRRVGFYAYAFEGLYRGNFLTHKVQYNPLLHVARNYLACRQALWKDRKESPELKEKIEDQDIVFPAYTPDKKVREKILSKLKDSGGAVRAGDRLFLVNPGEGVLPLREWPLEYFIELCSLILQGRDNRIVVIGTQGAQPKTRVLLAALADKRCMSMVGRTGLDELLELFACSEALISNDCGLAHLAMLTPVNKFIFFGPESPQVFGPYGKGNNVFYSALPCSPCLSVFNHRQSLCRDNLCLKSILPHQVYALVRDSCIRQ